MKNELFLLSILLIVAFMGLVYWHDTPMDLTCHELRNSSEGTANRDAVTYSQLNASDLVVNPKFAINQSMIDDFAHNMTIHINDTYEGNVTVMYGNKTIFHKEAA